MNVGELRALGINVPMLGDIGEEDILSRAVLIAAPTGESFSRVNNVFSRKVRVIGDAEDYPLLKSRSAAVINREREGEIAYILEAYFSRYICRHSSDRGVDLLTHSDDTTNPWWLTIGAVEKSIDAFIEGHFGGRSRGV
jgi:hypothetical protein